MPEAVQTRSSDSPSGMHQYSKAFGNRTKVGTITLAEDRKAA